MKISHGYTPSKPPLPPAEHGKSEIIEIIPRQPETFDREKHPDVLKEFQAIKRDGLMIELPESTRDLHPLLKQNQKYFKTAEPENDGRLRPCRQGCVHIRVSPEAVDRALRIMHALIRLLESQRFSVRLEKEGYVGTFVKILDEELKIALKEKVKRSEKVQTSEFDNKYEFHPTGLLWFEVESHHYDGLQHSCNDTESAKLEDKLLEMSDGLIEIAFRGRTDRLEREEQRRKREEERELREAEEQQRRQEKVQFDKLLNDARDWQTSQLLRSYVDPVRRGVSESELDSEACAKLEIWLEWAQEKADEVDPIRNGRG